MESWDDELHPNSIISELAVAKGVSLSSAAPTRIETAELTFVPIFEANFSAVCDLFIQTSEEVFEHYSEPKMRLPCEVRDFVDKRTAQWEAGDRFEYLIRYDGDLIGKTYLRSQADGASYTLGLWMQQAYWGRGFSGRRADALIHVAFRQLNATVVTVGTVHENHKSRRAIEKYIRRYGGSFYGNVPLPDALYHDPDDPHAVVRHPEWAITRDEFETDEKGISTTIDGIGYDQVTF
jgi:RimJ/RimL family protein N-acetyltransferase